MEKTSYNVALATSFLISTFSFCLVWSIINTLCKQSYGIFWYNTTTLYFSQTLPLRLENWITSVRECKEERYYRGLQLKIIHFYFKSNEMEKVQIFFYKYFQFPGGKSHTCLIIYFQLKAEIFQKKIIIKHESWIFFLLEDIWKTFFECGLLNNLNKIFLNN